MHRSLSLINFAHRKDKWSLNSFSTEKLTKSKCQVSIVVKYLSILNHLTKVETIFEPHHEKTHVCICENKDADQLRGNREADQRLCFHYIDSTIPLLSKSEISSH